MTAEATMASKKAPLTVKGDGYYGWGVSVKKISGFTPEELDELRHMQPAQMVDAVIDILDERNGKLGTCLANGYGVYGGFLEGDCVILRTGSNCD